jgi:hypothetical protein
MVCGIVKQHRVDRSGQPVGKGSSFAVFRLAGGVVKLGGEENLQKR